MSRKRSIAIQTNCDVCVNRSMRERAPESSVSANSIFEPADLCCLGNNINPSRLCAVVQGPYSVHNRTDSPASRRVACCLCGVPPHRRGIRAVWEERNCGCSHDKKRGDENMLAVIAVVLIVLWLLGFFAFHVTSAFIHIALIVGLILLVFHFMRGRRASA